MTTEKIRQAARRLGLPLPIMETTLILAWLVFVYSAG